MPPRRGRQPPQSKAVAGIANNPLALGTAPQATASTRKAIDKAFATLRSLRSEAPTPQPKSRPVRSTRGRAPDTEKDKKVPRKRAASHPQAADVEIEIDLVDAEIKQAVDPAQAGQENEVAAAAAAEDLPLLELVEATESKTAAEEAAAVGDSGRAAQEEVVEGAQHKPCPHEAGKKRKKRTRKQKQATGGAKKRRRRRHGTPKRGRTHWALSARLWRGIARLQAQVNGRSSKRPRCANSPVASQELTPTPAVGSSLPNMQAFHLALSKCLDLIREDTRCRRASDATALASALSILVDSVDEEQALGVWVGLRVRAVTAIRALLALAVGDMQRQECASGAAATAQRLQEDADFAQEYTLEHASPQAAADLAVLRLATAEKILFGDELYKLKLQLECEQLGQALLRQAEQEKDRLKSFLQAVSEAAACLDGADHPTKSLRDSVQTAWVLLRIESCTLPQSPPGDNTLYQRSILLAKNLLGSAVDDDGTSGTKLCFAVALRITQVLQAAMQAQGAPTLRMLQHKRAELEAAKKEHEQIAGDNLVASRRAKEQLDSQDGDVAGLRGVLSQLADARVADEAVSLLACKLRTQAQQGLLELDGQLQELQEEIDTAQLPVRAWDAVIQAFDADDMPTHLSADICACLREEQPLTDQFVDHLLHRMVEVLNEPRVCFFDSSFFPRLTSGGVKDGRQGWENVRNTLPSQDIFAFDRLLLHIHLGDSRRVLVVVSEPAAAVPSVFVMDSLGQNMLQAQVLYFLRGYLLREWQCKHNQELLLDHPEDIRGRRIVLPRLPNEAHMDLYLLECAFQFLWRGLGADSLHFAHPQILHERWCHVCSHLQTCSPSPSVLHELMRQSLRQDRGVITIDEAESEPAVDFKSVDPGTASQRDYEPAPCTPLPKAVSEGGSLTPFGSPKRRGST